MQITVSKYNDTKNVVKYSVVIDDLTESDIIELYRRLRHDIDKTSEDFINLSADLRKQLESKIS